MTPVGAAGTARRVSGAVGVVVVGWVVIWMGIIAVFEIYSGGLASTVGHVGVDRHVIPYLAAGSVT